MDQKYIPSEHRTESKYIKQVVSNVRKSKSLFKFLNNLLQKYFKVQFVKLNSSLRKEDKFRLLDEQLNNIKIQKLSQLLVPSFRKLGFSVFEPELESYIKQFDKVFWNRSFSSLSNGMGYNNSLIIYVFICLSEPKLIAESGVWRGFTSFILDSASGVECELKCFDINFDPLEWRSDRAEYFEHDISKEKAAVKTENLSVFLFDDHVSHYDRLLFAYEADADYVILDDDVSAMTVHSDGVPAVPTASMIFEYEDIPKQFKWESSGKIMEADIRDIDVESIKTKYTYCRLPDLTSITGYNNSSFSSILKRRIC